MMQITTTDPTLQALLDAAADGATAVSAFGASWLVARLSAVTTWGEAGATLEASYDLVEAPA